MVAVFIAPTFSLLSYGIHSKGSRAWFTAATGRTITCLHQEEPAVVFNRTH